MRTTVIWSFLSLVALATGGLVSGCDSDAKIAKSAAGESCDKTSDCNDGLKCLEGTCYKTTSHPSTGGSANNEGGEGNGTAGTVVVGPKPPVLGGEGESCTRRADCEDGLACLSQRCQKGADMGMGGEGNAPGPVLGGPGETCGLTSDCGPGMACLPNGIAPAPVDTLAIGSNSVGVCTLLDSGLTPSGKTCGHECIEAAWRNRPRPARLPAPILLISSPASPAAQPRLESTASSVSPTVPTATTNAGKRARGPARPAPVTTRPSAPRRRK
jgi:hypothetical protein